MMPILDAVGLGVYYLLAFALYMIMFLLMVCVPMAAVCAALYYLAKLIAFILGRGPRKGRTR